MLDVREKIEFQFVFLNRFNEYVRDLRVFIVASLSDDDAIPCDPFNLANSIHGYEICGRGSILNCIRGIDGINYQNNSCNRHTRSKNHDASYRHAGHGGWHSLKAVDCLLASLQATNKFSGRRTPGFVLPLIVAGVANLSPGFRAFPDAGLWGH